jgi:hypothetical protein
MDRAKRSTRVTVSTSPAAMKSRIVASSFRPDVLCPSLSPHGSQCSGGFQGRALQNKVLVDSRDAGVTDVGHV